MESFKSSLSDWVDFPIDYNNLSENTNEKAVDFLLQHPDKLVWNYFTKNHNEKAVDYILKVIQDHFNAVDNYEREFTQYDVNKIEYLEFELKTKKIQVQKNLQEIEHIHEQLSIYKKEYEIIKRNCLESKVALKHAFNASLSKNTNNRIIDLLKKYPEYIYWDWLSMNPNSNVLELLKENKDKLNPRWIWCSPHIFT